MGKIEPDHQLAVRKQFLTGLNALGRKSFYARLKKRGEVRKDKTTI